MGNNEKNKKSLPKGQKPQINGRHKAYLIWFSVIFFVAAWMFFLGILVGRGTAPVKFDIGKLQKKLAALKAADINKKLTRFKIDSDFDKHKANLDFYEDLQKGRDDIRPPEPVLKSKKNSLGEKQKKISKKTVSDKNKNSDESIRKDNTLYQKKIPDPTFNLTIQVASFKNQKDADRLVAKLKKRKYPAYSAIGVIPGKGIWYRVRIGYFKTRAGATHMLDRLKQENRKAFLIHR